MLLNILGWLLLIMAILCLLAAVTGQAWTPGGGVAGGASSGTRVNFVLTALLLGIVGWWLIEPPEFISRYTQKTAAPGSINGGVAGASTSNSPDAASQPLAMNASDMSASARSQELETRYGQMSSSTNSAAAASVPSSYGSAPAAFGPGGAPPPPPAADPGAARWARGDTLLPTTTQTVAETAAYPTPGQDRAATPAPTPAPVPAAARDDLGLAAGNTSSPPTPGWGNAPAPVRARLEGLATGSGTVNADLRAPSYAASAPAGAMRLPSYPPSSAPTMADIGAGAGTVTSPGRGTAATAAPVATLTPAPATSMAVADTATTATNAPARRATVRRVTRRPGWGPRPRNVAPGPLDVVVADRLGADQVVETMRLTVEGREVARWRVDADGPAIDLALRLPAPGLLNYVLEGEHRRPDGRIERLRGRGCTAFTQGRRMVVHRTRSGALSLR